MYTYLNESVSWTIGCCICSTIVWFSKLRHINQRHFLCYILSTNYIDTSARYQISEPSPSVCELFPLPQDMVTWWSITPPCPSYWMTAGHCVTSYILSNFRMNSGFTYKFLSLPIWLEAVDCRSNLARTCGYSSDYVP